MTKSPHEPAFTPKPGQVDYTNIRYAPVVNVIVLHDSKILLVKRSSIMNHYPGYWHLIAGYLDDSQSIEEKVFEELKEEVNIEKSAVTSVRRFQPFLQETPEYNKTWLVVPVLVIVNKTDIKLNWEAEQAGWFSSKELKGLKLVSGVEQVMKHFLKTVQ